MKPEERDVPTDSGKYPNGMRFVFVLAEEKDGDGVKWTSGRATGNVGEFGESFEVITDSPLVEPDKSYYHKEDIKNPDKHKLRELNKRHTS